MSDSTSIDGLRNKTLLISGGSRGIGLAIALRAARDGANITLLAKTDEPHPKLEGTIHTAAAAIEEAGGQALAVVGDVRDDDTVAHAVERTMAAFGGIDAVVNNASAIDLRPTLAIDMRRYDLMQDVNTRGTFLLSRVAAPYVAWSGNPHILTLSPPLNLDPRWAGAHLAYTLSKYGMSLCTLGLAEELRPDGIAVNSLWPRTTIATAAVKHLVGASGMARARTPEIMADAAHAILCRPATKCSGNFFVDEQVLREEGVTDFTRYALGDTEPDLDLFLDADDARAPRVA
jgi:citronellol/citronellal dehydrogenase